MENNHCKLISHQQTMSLSRASLVKFINQILLFIDIIQKKKNVDSSTIETFGTKRENLYE